MIFAQVIAIVDTAKLLRRFAQNVTNNLIRRAMRLTLAVMRTDVRARIPKDTGTEIKSIAAKVSIKRNMVSGVCGPRRGYEGKGGKKPARYAAVVEGGRKEIQVVKKKVLSDGNTFFGLKVKAVTGKHTFRELQAERGPTYAETFNGHLARLVSEALQ